MGFYTFKILVFQGSVLLVIFALRNLCVVGVIFPYQFGNSTIAHFCKNSSYYMLYVYIIEGLLKIQLFKFTMLNPTCRVLQYVYLKPCKKQVLLTLLITFTFANISIVIIVCFFKLTNLPSKSIQPTNICQNQQ